MTSEGKTQSRGSSEERKLERGIEDLVGKSVVA